MSERWFKVRERGATVRVELLGGATTFITMAYIVVVNLRSFRLPVSRSGRVRWRRF